MSMNNWYCKKCQVENHPARSTCWKCLNTKSEVAGESDDTVTNHIDDHHGSIMEPECRNCGTINPPGNKFCGNCGIVLKGNSYDIVQCDRPSRVINTTPTITDFGRWECPLCGSINGPARTDCYKCSWEYEKSKKNHSNSSSSSLDFGRWECPECGCINGPARTDCYNCRKVILSHPVDSMDRGDESQTQRSSDIKTSKAALTGVGGWLLLLVVGMMVIGPLVNVAQLSAEIRETEIQYPYFVSLGQWNTFKMTFWMTVLITSAMSIYGGWGLIRGRDWSSVRRAKVILWLAGPVAMIIAGMVIPFIIFGESDARNPKFLQELLRSVIVVSIWTAYLSKSKRIRNTYGGPK